MLLHVPNIRQFQDEIKCLHQSWNQAPCGSGQVLRSLVKVGFPLRFLTFFLCRPDLRLDTYTPLPLTR